MDNVSEDEKLLLIYQELKQQYSYLCRPILNGLWDDSVEVERPKVLFPPNDGVTFDAQVAESGFLQRNCAVISAFRRKNPDGTRRYKKDNLASSAALEQDLQDQGLPYFLLDGCFREKKEKRLLMRLASLYTTMESISAALFSWICISCPRNTIRTVSSTRARG